MTRIFMTLFFCGLAVWGFGQRSQYSDQQIIAVYSQVGNVHNRGLDMVFANFQKEFGNAYRGGNTLKDRELLYQKSDESVQNYVRTELRVTDIDLKQFVNHSIEMKSLLGKDLATAISFFPEGQTLSSIYMEAMKELNAVMDNEMACTEQGAYDRIVRNYIGRLESYKEKAYLVSSASTGFNSSVYWQNNYFRWKSFFAAGEYSKTSTTPATFSLSSCLGLVELSERQKYFGWAKSIAKADVAGIISGGINGCITGALGGTVSFPVVGTIGGCLGVGAVGAVTGGLSASASTAISVFVNWLFG